MREQLCVRVSWLRWFTKQTDVEKGSLALFLDNVSSFVDKSALIGINSLFQGS